ncbi:MAG: hypothetical protein GY820_42575 [Gammaproteobacteria bacterium]|nr:hypothetical protein [Gammaproteobacteria bacterium]
MVSTFFFLFSLCAAPEAGGEENESAVYEMAKKGGWSLWLAARELRLKNIGGYHVSR